MVNALFSCPMTSRIPLRDRVDAPSVASIPDSTEQIQWRRATARDADAILECARDMDAADHPHFVTTRDQIVGELELSYVNLHEDSLVAVDRSGTLVAYGFTVLNPCRITLIQSLLHGGVRPVARGRGIGRDLLAWHESRALQQFAALTETAPGWLMIEADERAVSKVRLAKRCGFHAARYFLEMNRDLSKPIAEREVHGYTFVPFDESYVEAVRLARNDAFRDHWGSQWMDEEVWSDFVNRKVFRPELSSLALDPSGEVAGFVLAEVREDNFATQGYSSAYIGYVGVPRAYRRQGIAPALLTHTMTQIAATGLEMAVLDVDSANPTGALGLYTDMGFTEAHRSLTLLKTV